jgi:hypothetical protein
LSWDAEVAIPSIPTLCTNIALVIERSTGVDHRILLMTITVAGLGFMSIRSHFFSFVALLLANSVLRSMFGPIVCLAVIFILGQYPYTHILPYPLLI